MNPQITQQIIQLDSTDQVVTLLRERRDAILQGIEEGQISADHDAVSELAELNIALGDVDVCNG